MESGASPVVGGKNLLSTPSAERRSQTGVVGQPRPTKPSAGPSALNVSPEAAFLDLESFRWRETAFATLRLSLLAALFCGKALFAPQAVTPAPLFVALMTAAFLLQGELVGIQIGRRERADGAIRALTISTLVWDVSLAMANTAEKVRFSLSPAAPHGRQALTKA
jgi:hypothetical protein